MIRREPAWRIFSSELNNAVPIPSGEDEYAPTYVISPLGAKINRVLVVGVITDITNVGSDEEPLLRATVSDPTGPVYVSAGQYQPIAAQALSELNPPEFVAVVGKVRVYSPEPGVNYLSVRAENVRPVAEDLRDTWVIEAAKSTLERIEAMKEVLNMDIPDAEEVHKIGFRKRIADGVVRATQEFGTTDLEYYLSSVIDAIQMLNPDAKTPSIDQFTLPKGAPRPAAAPKDEKIDASNEEDEELVLEVVKGLAEGDSIALMDVIEACESKGLDKVRVEEAINALMDKGLVYEPILGQLSYI